MNEFEINYFIVRGERKDLHQILCFGENLENSERI